MVEGSDCPEKEKRCRIIESLRGPGLEIVRSLRFSNPDAIADEYIAAVDSAFGSPESGEDLYFAYRLMQQKSGEKLSDYVQRLEPFLAKVVKKGGVAPQDMNRVRIEQILRGTVGADLMLLQLRIKDRRVDPPTFLHILSQIRVEEEHERVRHKVQAKVGNIGVQDCGAAVSVDIHELRAEVKALQAKMSELKASEVRKDRDVTQLPVKSFATVEEKTGTDALQKKVNRLSQKVKTLESKEQVQPVVTNTAKVQLSDGSSPSARKTVFHKGEDFFCYRCGEDGHISSKCASSENEKKVIRKLIASLRRVKDQQSNANNDSSKETVNCSVRKQVVHATEPVTIPDGLVGPTLTVSLKVNGNPCTALLDSGSQVTIIFEKWYQRRLSDVPVQPVSGLAIWGLSDES